jgi:hypothetical protein
VVGGAFTAAHFQRYSSLEKRMKAKEYAAEFTERLKSEGSHIVIVWLLEAFINETNVLIASRKPQGDSAFIGIFNELDDKWRAISDRLNGLLAVDGYRRLIKELHPYVHYQWMQSKDNKRMVGTSARRRAFY